MRIFTGTRAGMGAAVVLAAGLGLASGASAALTKISVSVTGTQTSTTHIVNEDSALAGCATAMADQTETVTLHTYRTEIIVVQPMDQGHLFFNPNFTRTQREVLTRGAVTRASTFTPGGAVPCGASTEIGRASCRERV